MKSPARGNSTPPPASTNPPEGEKKSINQELWQACAGPLVNLPASGTHVIYFPQGHSEQVAASMKKDVDGQIPSYPNLPSKLLCLLHNVTLQADPETDEVYAQMTLQPVSSFDKEALLRSDLSLKAHKPQPEFFCKTLTASDTSTHGGFSVPRRAAEKIFPPLDYSMQPPAQELVAKDLHDSVWTFRHIYRGQPKRHLLTTGWSLFVSGKRLIAGDSVLFIRDEKQQLLLGIRRANRQPTNLSSSVLSSDSMHIGVLAAAAHAYANNSPFTVFFNPRASPSEFVIPLAKYYKAVYGQQVSLGMRFRMMFETEESGTRRYMGTITGISDLDPVRWKSSQWRNLQVGWDESTVGERRTRVSVWEVEPVTAPFFICPPPFLRPKRPRLPGMPDEDSEMDNLFKRTMPWLGDNPHSLSGLSLMQWMNMQQNPSLGSQMPSNYFNTLPGSNFQNLPPELSRQLGFTNPQIPQQNNPQFNMQRSMLSIQQLEQFQKSQQPQLGDMSQKLRQNNLMNPNPSLGSSQVLQSQGLVQNLNSLQHLSPLQTHQIPGNLSQIQPLQQQAQTNDNQIQLQLLQRIQQQQQSLLSQQLNHMNQLHESQSFSRSLQPMQVSDMGLTQVGTSSQTQITAQPISKSNTNSQTNLYFSQPPHQLPNIQNQPENQGQAGIPMNPMSNHLLTARQSAITDEVPSRSTSPSMNNCPNVAHTIMHSRTLQVNPLISSNSLETIHQKDNVKPSIDIVRSQSQELLTRKIHQSIPTSQADYLDTSSATSISRSQNDIISQEYPQSIFFGDTIHDVEVQADLRNNIHTGANISGQLSTTTLVSETMVMKKYESTKDPQQEPSSSMVTQSFGVPDMAFNSIDSAISDSSFMNGGAWAPPPQYQRLRTYTKVYKRGAVGRSIDVTRYSGYDELKQDLARMFGVEGQMEDRGRVGWKLVYVDHENDVLLVGDDPWEDFVNCVRCIKILSPQEVQQMSLDGDFGNTSLPNQASTSSDGGNV